MRRNHAAILVKAFPGETLAGLCVLAKSSPRTLVRALSRAKASGDVIETRSASGWRYDGDVTIHYYPRDGAK